MKQRIYAIMASSRPGTAPADEVQETTCPVLNKTVRSWCVFEAIQDVHLSNGKTIKKGTKFAGSAMLKACKKSYKVVRGDDPTVYFPFDHY